MLHSPTIQPDAATPGVRGTRRRKRRLGSGFDSAALPRTLPGVPADVLRVGSPPLRFVIRAVTAAAEKLGFWRTPLRSAATATEEMGALDNLYWIHKSRHPIARWSPTIATTKLPDRDLSQVKLPPSMIPRNTLTIGACGDLLRSEGIDASRDILFENIAEDLFGPDLAFSNFESPVTPMPLVKEVIGDAGPPLECCSRQQFDIFKGYRGRNFDVLHTANNHMFDMGVTGIEMTQAALASSGIANLGTHRTPESYGRAVILDRNGIRLGFVSDCFGLNGHQVPERDGWRIHTSRLLSKTCPPDLSLLKRQIDDARAQDCDFIIASVHWGYEFEFFPREAQLDAARELVEYGADTLICHHPHVIQPVELYQTKRDPDRVAVIAYSLGSLTWGFMAPHIVLSTLLNLRLTKGWVGGQQVTYLQEARATPVFRSYVEEGGRMVTRIEKLDDHVEQSPFPSAWIGKIAEHARLVLGEAWVRRN